MTPADSEGAPACDSFRSYWRQIGQRCYPRATSILWRCDCGGSNSASQHLFKQDLQDLVNDLGIEIRVAHYPSYCSKYNPIERRLFPHVGRTDSPQMELSGHPPVVPSVIDAPVLSILRFFR